MGVMCVDETKKFLEMRLASKSFDGSSRGARPEGHDKFQINTLPPARGCLRKLHTRQLRALFRRTGNSSRWTQVVEKNHLPGP